MLLRGILTASALFWSAVSANPMQTVRAYANSTTTASPVPVNINITSSASLAAPSCALSCSYAEISRSSLYWSKYITGVTLATVVIVINERRNTTSTVTNYVESLLVNGTAPTNSVSARTDTNAAGTVTQRIGILGGSSAVFTYPTPYYDINSYYEWNGVIPYSSGHGTTCVSNNGTKVPLPSHTPWPTSTGTVDPEDVFGWSYTMQGDFSTRLGPGWVATEFPGQLIDNIFQSCTSDLPVAGASAVQAVSYLTKTSTAYVSDPVTAMPLVTSEDTRPAESAATRASLPPLSSLDVLQSPTPTSTKPFEAVEPVSEISAAVPSSLPTKVSTSEPEIATEAVPLILSSAGPPTPASSEPSEIDSESTAGLLPTAGSPSIVSSAEPSASVSSDSTEIDSESTAGLLPTTGSPSTISSAEPSASMSSDSTEINSESTTELLFTTGSPSTVSSAEPSASVSSGFSEIDSESTVELFPTPESSSSLLSSPEFPTLISSESAEISSESTVELPFILEEPSSMVLSVEPSTTLSSELAGSSSKPVIEQLSTTESPSTPSPAKPLTSLSSGSEISSVPAMDLLASTTSASFIVSSGSVSSLIFGSTEVGSDSGNGLVPPSSPSEDTATDQQSLSEVFEESQTGETESLLGSSAPFLATTTFGGETYALAPPEFTSGYVSGTQTLLPGGPVVTVSGVSISLPKETASKTSSTPVAIMTPDSTTYAVGSEFTSGYVFDTQTLVPGGSAILVSGTQISLPGEAAAQTSGAPVAILTSDATIYTYGLEFTSGYIFDAQTLVPGGSAIIVSGTQVSLPSEAAAQTSGVPVAVILSDGEANTADGNSAPTYVVGTQTLLPGAPAITISGTQISLASSGTQVVVGTGDQAQTQTTGVSGYITSDLGGSALATSSPLNPDESTPQISTRSTTIRSSDVSTSVGDVASASGENATLSSNAPPFTGTAGFARQPGLNAVTLSVALSCIWSFLLCVSA